MQRVLHITLVLALLGYMAGNCYSQQQGVVCAGDTTYNLSEQAVVFAKVFVPSAPYGREQFFNNWTRGSIAFEDGTSASNLLLSYNGYHDDLFWLRDIDMKAGVVPKESLHEFKLYKQDRAPEILFRKVFIPGVFSRHTIMQVLAEGEYTLYCQRKVNYQINQQEFSFENIYYLYRDGNYTRFKITWYGFVLQFPKEYRSQIRRILRVNNLRANNEVDVVEAINQLNIKLSGS